MKFEEFYIDGFGVFHKYHIKNLSQGLTIFVGPNEAGKSTILSFLKRIIFGFPDRRSALNLYPALVGGNHGGRLSVLTKDNLKYMIERYSEGDRNVKVTSPDGSTGGTSELSRLLGHANKDVFENIYAFGLTELQNFETLNNEAVRERIYSAGAGIGSVSLSGIQREMEKKGGEIFKPGGSNPEINVLFRSINEVNSRIREIEKDNQRFDDLHRKLDLITGDISGLEKDRNQTRTELNHTLNLISGFNDWLVAQESKVKLEKIPEIKSFPEKGSEKFERYLDESDKLSDALSQKNEKKERIKIQKLSKKVDENLIKHQDKISDLQKGQEKYISAVKDLPNLNAKLRADKDTLRESLNDVGSGWTEERLSNFDASISTKEVVRRKSDLIAEIYEKKKDTDKEIKKIEGDIKAAEIELETLDKNLDAKAFQQLDEKKLSQERKSLHALRAKYPQLKEKEGSITNNTKEIKKIEGDIKAAEIELETLDKNLDAKAFQQLDEKKLSQERKSLHALRAKYPQLKEKEINIHNIRDKEELLAIIKPQKVTALPSLPLWPALALILVGIISLTLFVLGNNLIFGVIIFVLSLIMGIIYFFQNRKNIMIAKEESKGTDIDDFAGSVTGWSDRGKALESEMQKIKGEMLSDARMCGFETIPNPQQIEEKDQELQTMFANLSKLDDLRRQKTTFIQKTEGLHGECGELNKFGKALESEMQKIKGEMLSDAKLCGFETIPDPQQIEGKDQELQTMFANLSKLDDLRKQKTTLIQRLEKYKEEVSYSKKTLDTLECDLRVKQEDW